MSCRGQKFANTPTVVLIVTKSGGISPSILMMQTPSIDLLITRLFEDIASGWWSAQLDRECRAPMTDEDGQNCNGSPILEACASDEIH